MAKHLIFLLGASRSGTSILENYLGKNRGYLSLGEVRWAFERGFRDNDKCGCGCLCNECEFWSKQNFDDKDLQKLSVARKYYDLPFFLRIFRNIEQSDKELYQRAVREIYDVAFKKSDVVIDNSKRPEYLHLLAKLLKDSDVRIIVLPVIRNPMGNIKSWSTEKDTTESTVRKKMNKFNPLTAIIFYSYYNFYILKRRMTKNDLLPIFDIQHNYELPKNLPNNEMSLNISHYHPISGNPDNNGRKDVKLIIQRPKLYGFGIPLLPLYWLVRALCK